MTPSTMISGSCDPLMEVAPLSRMSPVEPGWPEPPTTLIPGTFPTRKFSADTAGTGVSARSSFSTVNGNLTFGVARATPVTMSSCSSSAPLASSALSSAVSPAVTSTCNVRES